jgi:hypothetical protein
MRCVECKQPIVRTSDLVVANRGTTKYKWLRCHHAACFSRIDRGVESIPRIDVAQLGRLRKGYYAQLAFWGVLALVYAGYVATRTDMALPSLQMVALLILVLLLGGSLILYNPVANLLTMRRIERETARMRR